MIPSIEEKNAAIAEMLGAEKEQWYPENKDNKTTGIYYKFPKDIAIGLGLTTLPASGDYGLKFHSDANWQFEAIKFIKTLKFNTIISWNFIAISDHRTKLAEKVILLTYKDETKEAIFEALYQFSEYLKKK